MICSGSYFFMMCCSSSALPNHGPFTCWQSWNRCWEGAFQGIPRNSPHRLGAWSPGQWKGHNLLACQREVCPSAAVLVHLRPTMLSEIVLVKTSDSAFGQAWLDSPRPWGLGQGRGEDGKPAGQAVRLLTWCLK